MPKQLARRLNPAISSYVWMLLTASLQCRRILCVRVHTFLLGRHLGLVNVDDWGEEIFAEGVGVKWKNMI